MEYEQGRPQPYIYGVHTVFLQKFHVIEIYGHTRRTYTALANSKNEHDEGEGQKPQRCLTAHVLDSGVREHLRPYDTQRACTITSFSHNKAFPEGTHSQSGAECSLQGAICSRTTQCALTAATQQRYTILLVGLARTTYNIYIYIYTQHSVYTVSLAGKSPNILCIYPVYIRLINSVYTRFWPTLHTRRVRTKLDWPELYMD
jgi:hypothetical protein